MSASKTPVAAGDLTRKHFRQDCLKYVLQGGLRMPDGHQPQAGFRVPDDYAGVCVASQQDPEADAKMIGYLNELGIRHVRMDFTYDSLGAHGERFLAGLLEEDFQVLLRLLPPPAEAERMAEPSVHQRWETFVGEVLQRFGNRLEAVEIGNVVNRRRWSGYKSIEDFMTAWSLAWKQVRAHGVTLAGPNVTDFEPPYNYAFLKAMQRRGELPDIHTNNLFVERVIRPEAYDHRVAGRWMTLLLKLNLIKKARMLGRLGDSFGITRTYSTTAFWTLPRIGRRLVDSEEKQADYLTRYMVLTAASGGLQRAYWGPLVSQREGLVDDATGQPASHELVGQYTQNNGCWRNYVRRPAFSAMATFNRLIPGTRYLGAVPTGTELHIHRFANDTRQVHVVWTTNSQAAVLEDIYTSADLAQAEVLDHTAEPLDSEPGLATEVPLYLCWPAAQNVAVNAAAKVVPGLIVHANRPDGRHYYYSDDTWRGAVFAASRTEADQLIAVLHPDRVAPPGGENILRKARNVIWSIDDPTCAGRKLAIKKPNRLKWNKKIVDHFKPTKGMRSWSGANQLRRMGIDSPAPVAWFERHTRKDTLNNWYVCVHAGKIPSVRDFFEHYTRGETEYMGFTRDEFFRPLSEFLLQMHGKGVFFRDLAGGNILVETGPDNSLEFTLIDTARARFYDKPTSLGKRLSDLKRTCYKLDWAGREAFMSMYLEALGHSFSWPYRVPFHYFDWKAKTKRRLKGKHKRSRRKAS